jgi:hypothetical protein
MLESTESGAKLSTKEVDLAYLINLFGIICFCVKHFLQAFLFLFDSTFAVDKKGKKLNKSAE